MSSHLQWLVIRNNSAFIKKGAHGNTFSTEAGNLKGKNSFRFSGLVHTKTVAIEPSADKKGLVVTTRKQSNRNKPVKNSNKISFQTSSGPRRVLGKIRKTLRATRYRKDLKTAALRKASALMRAQKVKAAPAAEKKAQQKS